MLHDARNLIGAVGLYCDLLSMPHVLCPEHRHYADELRLLGERSAAMIERLIERRTHVSGAHPTLLAAAGEGQSTRPGEPCTCSADLAESLRTVVERCAGLLGRIAEGHAIEIAYGEAAALPVHVPAGSVERILINLVRNASAALFGMGGGIRIGVGLLPEDTGGMMRLWPFQRVRLTVEDSGCGMAGEKVKKLLDAHAPLSSGHGIGFRVVCELVEASGGELAVASRLGHGTRIEMESPVAQSMEQVAAAGIPASGFGGERRRMAWQS